MAKTTVADLRFNMSAGTADLRAGCKEGEQIALRSSKRIGDTLGKDAGGGKWGKKQFGALKFVAKDIGSATMGSSVGQLAGAFKLESAFGAAGVAMAGSAVVAFGLSKALDYLSEEGKKARDILGGALDLGVTAEAFQQISNVAGDDKTQLEGLAIGIQKVSDAGDNAIDGLRGFAKLMEDIGGSGGDSTRDLLAKSRVGREADTAKENLFSLMDVGGWVMKAGLWLKGGYSEWEIADEKERLWLGKQAKRSADLFKKGKGISDSMPGQKFANQFTELGNMKGLGAISKDEYNVELKRLQKEAAGGLGELRTPLETFKDKVQDINRLRNVGAIDDTQAQRAALLARQEFEKAGAGNLPGLALKDTQEAYSAIVRYQDSSRDASQQAADVLAQYLPRIAEGIESQRGFQHQVSEAAN